MLKHLPRWLRWGCLIALLAVLLPLAAYGAISLLLSASTDTFALLPHDCNGVSIFIAGEVRDDDYQPIGDADIVVSYTSIDRQSDWNLRLVSDSLGHYEADRPMSIFLCDNVGFTVSATGYESIRVTYALLDTYSETEWPVQSPIPIRINPILSPKLNTGGA